LLSGTWDVSFDVVASLAEVGETDAASFQADIESELSDTSFQATVVASIASVETFESVTSVVQTRNPSSVPVPAPTAVPVPAPIPAPTPLATKKAKKNKSNGANAASLAVILIAVGAGVFVIVAGTIAYFQYKRTQEKDVEMNFGLNEEINTFNVDNDRHSDAEGRNSGVFSSQLNKLRQSASEAPVTESAIGKHMDL